MNGQLSYDDPPPPPPPTDGIPPPPPISDLPPPPPPSDAAVPPPPPSDSKAPKKAGWVNKTSKTPLSYDEILKKKREAEEAAKKPKFLSKAAREKLALEKRAKEVEEQKRREESERLGRIETAPPPKANGAYDRRLNGTNGASHSSRDVPTGPSAMRQKDRDQKPKQSAQSTASSKKKAPETEEDIIRKRYMGQDQNTSKFSASKKRKRTTEKKFNFEWNVDEDTSADYNPLYAKRAELSLYGRGRLGGFDDQAVADVANKYAKALQERDGAAGSERAMEIMEMERRRQEGEFTSRTAIDKHWSEKPLAKMRERDWRIFKEDFNISMKGGSLPDPIRSWAESGLPSKLLDIISQVGYKDPSPIQRASIPIALQNRDVIGVAVTGSGKTAAFVLPLLVYISSLPPLDDFSKNDGPYALILAPTRELAQQIENEAKRFATPLGYTCVSIVGGHSIEEQAYNLRDGAEIIIATPGRLVDCIERRIVVLSQCCYVVMDEADRMIDLGFEESVNRILDALPVSNEKPDTEEAEDPSLMTQGYYGPVSGASIGKYRQTMMFTATMPPAIERMTRKYLRRPAIVTIGNAGEAVETVEQRVEFVSGEDKKKKRLADILLRREFKPPIIVFVNIKRNCDAVARDIKSLGFSCVTLHGSKTQDQREAALASLRDGSSQVLVATDLAGRGIDVSDVSLVINFNMATSIESYTHRIGRTGRAGKSGVAITFLGPEDADVLWDLKQMLSKSSISKVPDELKKHEAAQQKPQRGAAALKKIE